ncbi:MAG TPA: hypothetical protein VEK15_04545 [Vicinamibacteria bacterium]|nr:hypothetical protein [Vicinamibacteria bacterium]
MSPTKSADPNLDYLGEGERDAILLAEELGADGLLIDDRDGLRRGAQDVRDILRRRGQVHQALFLSATPHNGHSNSFSTLLELPDPYRFTRGVRGKKALEVVMVRRLEEDIREAQCGFPMRMVERVPSGPAPD